MQRRVAHAETQPAGAVTALLLAEKWVVAFQAEESFIIVVPTVCRVLQASDVPNTAVREAVWCAHSLVVTDGGVPCVTGANGCLASRPSHAACRLRPSRRGGALAGRYAGVPCAGAWRHGGEWRLHGCYVRAAS